MTEVLTLRKKLPYQNPCKGRGQFTGLTMNEAAHLGKMNAIQNDHAAEFHLSVHLVSMKLFK